MPPKEVPRSLSQGIDVQMILSKFFKVPYLLPLFLLLAIGAFFHFFALQWSTSPVALSEATAENLYVINLDRTPERFMPLKKQLEGFGLPYTRWSGTDGYKLVLTGPQGQVFTGQALKAGKAAFAMGEAYQLHVGKMPLTYVPQDYFMTAGELGCAASHFSLWHHIAQQQLSWALIFEDDAQLSANFSKELETLLGRLPGGWDIVYLSFPLDDSKKRQVNLLGNGSLKKLGADKRSVSGTYAYILSLKGAKKALAFGKGFPGAIDNCLGDGINAGALEAYINVTPLVSTGSLPSVLNPMGKREGR